MDQIFTHNRIAAFGDRAAAPEPAQTALAREVYRHAISKLDVSHEQPNQWVAHLVVPADVGGFTIREVGLLTDAGELYAVANCAAIEKPVTGINVNLQFRLAVSETASIELKVSTGDGLFLRQDANLNDLENVNAARKALKIENVGNFLAVEANGGRHSSGNHMIAIDWGEDSKLYATVDLKDAGEIFTSQNPPTAAQTGAYPRTGGNLDENASITAISSDMQGNNGDFLYTPMYRTTLKGRGGDQDFKDGASFFMRLVEHIGTLAYGELVFDGFGSINSFVFDQNGSFHANDNIYAGQSWLAGDGNVYGSALGGYLSTWLNSQLGAVNQNIANQINNVRNWTYGSFVNGMRLGAYRDQTSIKDSGGPFTLGSGEMIVGLDNMRSSDVANTYWKVRALLYLINGQWVQAGSL